MRNVALSLCTAMFMTTTLLANQAIAETITVAPGEDIQAAIESAQNGDVIQLEAGHFLPITELNPGGKALTVRGSTDLDGTVATILNGQLANTLLVCQSGESTSTSFQNIVFTACPNKAVALHNSSPSFVNCTFSSSNRGMFNTNSHPTLLYCRFLGNSSGPSSSGGGMYNTYSNPQLTNCIFIGNSAASGGAMGNDHYSRPVLTNCVIHGNNADSIAAIRFGSNGGQLINCRVCENQGTGEQVTGGSYTTTCIQDSCNNCVAITLTNCNADINGDGQVDPIDLALLLGDWGPCE